MQILGQNKIVDKVNSLNLDSLPHTILLLGDVGSGKNLICDYIASSFNLELIDITENLKQDYLDDLSSRVEPYLYKIRARNITIKEQNVILKFLEEPLKNSFIVICCDNKNQILPTIFNRCQTWNLEIYSREILKSFTNNELILNICNTPGKIKKLESLNIDDILNLGNKIIDKIGIANIPNLLSISGKLNFNNEQDKIDFDLLVDCILYLLKEKCYNTSDNILLQQLFSKYNLTAELKNNSYIFNINKKHLFENYLLKLKELTC